MNFTTTARNLAVLTLVAGAWTTAPAAESELDAFKAAIRVKYDLKEKAFADHDPEPIINDFYAPDVISVSGQGPMLGREGIRPMYEAVIHNGARIESIRTHVEGNSGWDWANFYIIPENPSEEPSSLAILFLWEKRNGEWWCVGDIYVAGKLEK